MTRISGRVATTSSLMSHRERRAISVRCGRSRTSDRALGGITANWPTIGGMNRSISSLIVIATLVLAACGSGSPSGSTASVAPPAPSTAPSSAASTASGTASETGQTDTEWGRIWDTLPRKFPQIPGARPSEEAATGPASATFVIGGDVSRQVAAALVTLFASAGFPTGGLGTPLENGAYVLEATGPTPGCKMQVTVEPKGGDTLVTILYGADCPHD